MKKLAGVLAVAVVAAGAVGCGGGGDTTTTATIPPREYTQKVNELCTKTENKKYEEVGAAFRKAAKQKGQLDEESLSRITVTVIVPVFEEMTQELRRLPLPSGREKEAAKVVQSYEEDIEKTKKQPQRFEEGVAFAQGNEAAQQFGLAKCVF